MHVWLCFHSSKQPNNPLILWKSRRSRLNWLHHGRSENFWISDGCGEIIMLPCPLFNIICQKPENGVGVFRPLSNLFTFNIIWKNMFFQASKIIKNIYSCHWPTIDAGVSCALQQISALKTLTLEQWKDTPAKKKWINVIICIHPENRCSLVVSLLKKNDQGTFKKSSWTYQYL